MTSIRQQLYWDSLKGKKPKNMNGLKLGQGWNKQEEKVEMIICACGCGNKLNKFDRKNRERRYIRYHDVKMKGNRKGRFGKKIIPWNKDKKGLIVAWNKGKKLPFYPHPKAIGRKSWNKGKHLLEETKKKIGKANKGKISWNKGLKMSSEYKKKMNLKGLELGRKGKKHSLEARLKISLAKKGKLAWNKGLKSNFNSEHFRKMGYLGVLKQSKTKEPTSIEKKLYNELKRRGLLFEKQYLINGKFLVDAYIPSLNLIIEADGDYWHNLDRVKKKDKAENAYLTKCGFNLMRWREADINTDINSLFSQIEN